MHKAERRSREQCLFRIPCPYGLFPPPKYGRKKKEVIVSSAFRDLPVSKHEIRRLPHPAAPSPTRTAGTTEPSSVPGAAAGPGLSLEPRPRPCRNGSPRCQGSVGTCCHLAQAVRGTEGRSSPGGGGCSGHCPGRGTRWLSPGGGEAPPLPPHPPSILRTAGELQGLHLSDRGHAAAAWWPPAPVLDRRSVSMRPRRQF